MKKILIPIVAALVIVGFFFQQGYGEESETLDDHSIDNALQRTNAGSISPDKTVYPVPLEDRSPLKQFKDGITLTKIKCKANLTLLKKTSNGLPICVSIKTGQKLLERKWAQSIAVTGSLESTQKSDSYQREITILSISPKNVTLPEPKNQTHKTKCNKDGVCFTPE